MSLIDRITGKKKVYDLNTLAGIESIEIPKYKKNSGIQSPVNNIEYILQRKATEHKRNGRMDLAIACLRKSNEIFPHSNFLWAPDDYMRLVEFLKQAGRFDEARAEEKIIEALFQSDNSDDSTISELEMVLLECKSEGIDLLETTDNSCVCGECAKYTRRIFSGSGKDKRFPAFPVDFNWDAPEHSYCYHSFNLLDLDFQEPTWKYRGNLVAWCNRPYKDERTREQKVYFKNRVTSSEQEIIDRKNFDFVREHLPENAPKSFGGYRKMKNTRSANYLKLYALASEKEVNLDELPDLAIYHF